MTYFRKPGTEARYMREGLARYIDENQRLRRQLGEAMRIARTALDVWHDEYHDGLEVEDCESGVGECRAWCKLRDEIAADDAARKAGR